MSRVRTALRTGLAPVAIRAALGAALGAAIGAAMGAVLVISGAGCRTIDPDLKLAGSAEAGAPGGGPGRGLARSASGRRDTVAGAGQRARSLSFAREEESGLPGMYYGSLVVADLDGDQKPDVVMSGNFDTVFDSLVHGEADAPRLVDRVRLYRNVTKQGGPIRFELVEERRDVHGSRGSLVVGGDFDGDGRRDFAVEVRNGDEIAAFMNRGGWRFERVVVERGFVNASTSLGMVATDVDRDGRDDLVFLSDGAGTGSSLWYSFDAKTGAWTPRQKRYPHAIGYGGAIAAGDLDGDGFPDLAVGGNSRAPFGDHQCGNLMIGEAVRNFGKKGKSAGFELAPLAIFGNFGLRQPPERQGDTSSCHGMDNAGLAIADLDGDGKKDVIIAGSATGIDGPPDQNGQQYDFAVLFNDGGGKRFTTWENVGPQDDDGTTNGGVGNVDFPNIAIGDLDGDGRPEVLIQGHHRDYAVRFDVNGDGIDKDNPYVFRDMLFHNEGDRTFTEIPLEAYLRRFGDAKTLPKELGYLAGRPKWVGEGGVAIADLDGDGKNDLIISGATLPFHTNGANARDHNTRATLATYVLRSE